VTVFPSGAEEVTINGTPTTTGTETFTVTATDSANPPNTASIN